MAAHTWAHPRFDTLPQETLSHGQSIPLFTNEDVTARCTVQSIAAVRRTSEKN